MPQRNPRKGGASDLHGGSDGYTKEFGVPQWVPRRRGCYRTPDRSLPWDQAGEEVQPSIHPEIQLARFAQSLGPVNFPESQQDSVGGFRGGPACPSCPSHIPLSKGGPRSSRKALRLILMTLMNLAVKAEGAPPREGGLPGKGLSIHAHGLADNTSCLILMPLKPNPMVGT